MQNSTKSPSLVFILYFILLTTQSIQAQKPKRYSAADIQLELKKLNVLGSALYVAAHPDDENTRLIAYLSNERLINTAYLSMTRGDGGQNLVGPEIREQLGVIRTQELLQARRLDGGQQFFTRANDFGYSKSPEETLRIWDKDKVLADAVWVIRKFRPDVIITRFPTNGGGGHGHHTASAIIAKEAFDLAGDKNAFPEQLKYVDVWKPKRLYLNTGRWWNRSITKDSEGVVIEDVGAYNELLGKSYTEIAAESRSMHKSQGFGSTGRRGESIEFLEYRKGDKAEKNIFEGIDLSWSRVKGSNKVGKLIEQANQQFDPSNPSEIVPTLMEAYKALQVIQDKYWRSQKAEDIKKVIKACLGLYLEGKASDYYVAPGNEIKIDFEAINRSDVKVVLKSVKLNELDSILNKNLTNNEIVNFKSTISLDKDVSYSQPYWLRKEGTMGLFNVEDQQLIGLPENRPALNASFEVEINGTTISFGAPIIYKWNDPVNGELYRPLEVIPPASVAIKEKVIIFPDNESKNVEVLVKSGRNNLQGKVTLSLPEGWRTDPVDQKFNFKAKGEEKSFSFKVYPPEKQSVGSLKGIIEINGKTYDQELKIIAYDHFPTQTLLPKSESKIVKLDIQKRGSSVGYIMGAGDQVPESLEQIGYKVEILQTEDFGTDNLKRFDAIILGIRAYNTVQRLKFAQNDLLSYVKGGGNLIVQYNTSFRLVTNEYSPYPLKISRDRVTQEDAPVTFLAKEHEVLNQPNKITKKDFELWVQERGLYFPNEWGKEFTPILSWNDLNEDPKNGGLLVSKYGEGHFIYTGISFFRQLPAGVPGAYRLFTNLISIGLEESVIK